MRIYEIKEECYDNVMGIVKKIAKYATEIEDALEQSEVNHRMHKEYDDDDYDYRKYKGTRYSRY